MGPLGGWNPLSAICYVLITSHNHNLPLQDGSLLELVNLVPLGGLSLSLCPLRLSGMDGWDGLGAGVAREWCSHIARTQVSKHAIIYLKRE